MAPRRNNAQGPPGMQELALPRSVPTGLQCGCGEGWILDFHPRQGLERGGPASLEWGRMARAASLASIRCAKGAQQMLSEESDLSHFVHLHGVGLQRWPRPHAPTARPEPGFTLVCRGQLFECTSQSSLGC